MSDSDSGSEYLDCGDLRRQTQRIFGHDFPVLTLHPSEETYKTWHSFPLCVRLKHGKALKVCSFWLPMVLQRQRVNSTTRWAMQVGFIDTVESDLELTHVYKIEVIESVLRALDRGCVSLDNTKHLIWISNNLNLHVPEVLDDALQWLQRTGEPNICQQVLDLGPKEICFLAIQYIFAEYAQFVQSMGVNAEGMVRALTRHHNDADKVKSEDMKTKGNTFFQKKEYGAAIKCYTQAIRHTPENHMVYANRALCYIRVEKYLKAVGDGKRATLLEPFWAKGHYRYCEALFSLKEHRKAIEANELAQCICIPSGDGLKDLVQQKKKFISEMTEKAGPLPETKNKRQGISSKSNPGTSLPSTDRPAVKVDTKLASGKVPHVKAKKTNPGLKEGITPALINSKLSKQQKSETDRSKNEGPKVDMMNKSKNEKDHSKEKNVAKSPKTNMACIAALRSAVQDGYVALADLRCWLAEKAFSQALALLQTTPPKDLGISTLDEAVLHYGRASALIEIGQPQELGEALKEFDIIKTFEKRTFECLVYYGIGRVYFKENRFKDALAHFTDSMQMVTKRITPGKLTWPLTKEIVKETQLDYFKESLLELMASCQFPPMPDAICRHGNCIGPIKTAIYFTDPDFKGFIRLVCGQGCVVEYHISCWKSLKTDSNEKDFLQRDCLTPDCKSSICSIQIYGSTGLIKCKFETVIRKPERLRKFRVNQKSTSLKNLQSKEERKLRRKQAKQVSKDTIIRDSNDRQEERDAAREEQSCQEAGPSSGRSLLRDRGLFQLQQNRELLGERRGDDLPALVARLMPWVELDSSKGNAVAARILGMGPSQVETLGQVVDLLLERENRVWARVLIEFLGGSLKWARRLDNEGLNAARVFMETHAGHLELIDPSPLLPFEPMKMVMVRKFESQPELVRQPGITFPQYLKGAPAQDLRVFIWSLEEHRGQFECCHTMLDEFFDILDGDCVIMKKSDNLNENNSPVKTRNKRRKKKPKDQKAVLVPSGMRGGTQRHEQDFFDDDDSLSYLGSGDPFSVPDHLRDQVASFESHYNPPTRKTILDDNPDPTVESLYDYFAQILEEHGPLGAGDPLLLGQLDLFPPEARQRIQRSGGFRAFLLQSPRFVLMGEHIGLDRPATVSLQGAWGRGLDHLDELQPPSPGPPATPSPYDEYQQLLALPCPYPYYADQKPSSRSASADCVSNSSGTTGSDAGVNTSHHFNHSSGSDSGDFEPKSSEGCRADRGDVAVNAENGRELNKVAQKYRDLDHRLRYLERDSDQKAVQHKSTVAALEKAIEETNTNIQVTHKEVELFQQKLEEMVRRDQKEKRANQEELKALKMESEELAGQQARLSRSLQEKRIKYDKQLRDFCDLSNQSAAEKMSLEDEIKRCRDLCTKAAARSRKAELSTLEINQKQSLHCLNKSLSDSLEILLKLEEVAPRYPPQVMAVFQLRWRQCVQEAREKISVVESQYQEQAEQVKRGARLSALPPIRVPNAPEPPVAVTFSSIQKLSFAEGHNVPLAPSQHRPEPQPCGPSQAQSWGPTQAQAAEAPQVPVYPPPSQRNRPLEPQQATKFDKILEQLSIMFPDYNRQELMKSVQTFRRSNGGALTTVTFEDVINGVSQIILDHQGLDYSAQPPNAGSGVRQQNGTSSALPPASHVWLPLGTPRHCPTNALNVGDPCIICHDDMPPESVCVLQCRHSFHKECIRSWLKEQSTCPTCRKHALLPEDFPMLAGRWPTGRPAPSFS
ncbi:E3 ubiquitin-protein ligase TTC3 [Gadus macrocephalus]|uniref:E3 ubiquitin-protein ligase TTC3 n=1 Tax=Gadus macrocephalus TaxID=80720 RepID=UPI0028CB6ED4|nr:E3 ubiquitin-protein ligase TTC3 [Gadus macrocephalus]XP_059912347.1 E3 ubiquitin-protein ligase TTC3 [Gadus macrocephalus]XP_059912348.1 E3 ubiquitin-protein ligase TTC3 [Gadus macrocephalus]